MGKHRIIIYTLVTMCTLLLILLMPSLIEEGDYPKLIFDLLCIIIVWMFVVDDYRTYKNK